MKKVVLVFVLFLLTTSVYAFSFSDKISSFSIKDTLSSFSVKNFFTNLFHKDVIDKDLKEIKPVNEPIRDVSGEQIESVDTEGEQALDTEEVAQEALGEEIGQPSDVEQIITQEPIVITQEEVEEEETGIIVEQELDLDEEIIPVQKVPGGQIIYPNTKNMNFYSNKNVFLISDTNWKDVLPLVPVTTWTDEGVIYKYPTLVYHVDENLNYAFVDNGVIADASSFQSIWNPYLAIDGRWGEGWWSESSDRHWLLIDFNQIREINNIKFVAYSLYLDYYLTIKVSTDNVNYNIVVDNYYINTDTALYSLYSFAATYVFDFDLQEARYVKFEFNPSLISPFDVLVREVEIYNTNDIINAIDVDSTIHFLQLYDPDMATVVGEAPQELYDLLIADFDPITKEGGAGLNENQLESITPSDYLNYWSFYDDIVWVEDNYQLALLASTYASLRNAPLIIGETSLDIFDNKNVILVGNLNCPSNARSCENFYTIEDLQYEYIEKTNTDKLLLTNPNELYAYLGGTFYPEKSRFPISGIFNKHSLVSPILASAKHELIILTESYNIEDTDQLVEEVMSSFFNNDAEYLTIVAPPYVIPDYNFLTEDQVDLNYAKEPDISGDYFFLAPGRIYGITSSDVSSYIARSLFYDELINNIYNEDEYTAFTIGRETYGPGDADAMKVVRDYLEANGYDVEQTLCSSHYANGCEHVGSNLNDPDEQDLLRNKQFIQFSDHGQQTAWVLALTYYDMPWPWLDVPVTGGVTACSTAGYLVSHMAFSVNILRKGAMAYFGSVPITYVDTGLRDNFAKILTSNIGTLGGVNKLLYSSVSPWWTYDKDYIMLGDPTLIPKFNYIEGFDYSCYDFVDNDNDGLIDSEDCGCSYATGSEFLPEPECNDGIDNDNDGLIDYPEDISCTHSCDETEGPETFCGGVITESVILGYNILDCESDGLIIGASDITIDCDGYTISHVDEVNGDDGVLAQYGTIFDGVTIKNCIINNFGSGIFLDNSGSNYHLISNDIQNNFYNGIHISFGMSNFELTLNTVLGSNLDIFCENSNGFYSNGPNTCETLYNYDCNPPVTCVPP